MSPVWTSSYAVDRPMPRALAACSTVRVRGRVVASIPAYAVGEAKLAIGLPGILRGVHHRECDRPGRRFHAPFGTHAKIGFRYVHTDTDDRTGFANSQFLDDEKAAPPPA